MKRTFMLLAMALSLLLFLAGTVPAIGTPPGGPYDPIGGDTGGEDDGDHPWGGDRVIGNPDGSTITRAAGTSIITGYLAIDIAISYLYECWTLQAPKSADKGEILTSPARPSNRFRPTKGVQR